MQKSLRQMRLLFTPREDGHYEVNSEDKYADYHG